MTLNPLEKSCLKKTFLSQKGHTKVSLYSTLIIVYHVVFLINFNHTSEEQGELFKDLE